MLTLVAARVTDRAVWVDVRSYQEDIPQNVAELAYKVNFGLQI